MAKLKENTVNTIQIMKETTNEVLVNKEEWKE